jgi:predicted metalloenzyme YecM
MESVESFFAVAKPFVEIFDAWARPFSGVAHADHLCFKCGSSEEFEHLRGLFEGQCAFIYQSIISKRRIAIVKFLSPMTTVLGDIWYLELPDSKANE